MRLGCKTTLLRRLNRDQHIHHHDVSLSVSLTAHSLITKFKKSYWFVGAEHGLQVYARYINQQPVLVVKWYKNELTYIVPNQRYKIKYHNSVICYATARINDVSIVIGKGCARAKKDFPDFYSKVVEHVKNSMGVFRVFNCDLLERYDEPKDFKYEIVIYHKNHLVGWLIYHLYHLCL
jgi:hypothetical protein